MLQACSGVIMSIFDIYNAEVHCTEVISTINRSKKMIGHDPPLFEKHCLELHHILINKIVIFFTHSRVN